MRYYRRDHHCRLKYCPPAPLVRTLGPSAFYRVSFAGTITPTVYDSQPHHHKSLLNRISDQGRALSLALLYFQYTKVAGTTIRSIPEMAAIWESHKDTPCTLYIVRGETLKRITVHMREQYGFEMRCVHLSHIHSSTKSLNLLQQRSIRASVQETGFPQKQ